MGMGGRSGDSQQICSSLQTVTSLKLSELWAIPIMLRLALIENLRRIAARIATDRIDRNWLIIGQTR